MQVLLGIVDWIADAMKNVVETVAKPVVVTVAEVSGKFADKAAEAIDVKKILENTAKRSFNTLSDTLDFKHDTGDTLLNKILLNGGDPKSNWQDILDIFTGRYFMKVLSWSHKDYFDDIGDNNFYSKILDMMQKGVMPTAMVIFSLIILVELFQITTRTEGMRNSGFEAPFKLMFKVAVCKIFIDNTHNVLDAIADMGLDLVNVLKKVWSDDGDVTIYTAFNKVIQNLKAANVWTYVAVVLLAVLLCLMVTLITTSMCFLLLARVIDVYIMIVLAPIPFATFSHQELSQIGKNFLKQFVGISLKPAVMYVILMVYLNVLNHAVFGMAKDWSQNIIGAVGTVFLGPIGFVIPLIIPMIKIIILCTMMSSALSNSDKFVKMITGAFY